jgi:hypothetical protein
MGYSGGSTVSGRTGAPGVKRDMKSIITVILTGLVCFMCVINSNASDPATEAKGLVDDAIAMFRKKGREYTLKVMNSVSGPFRSGSMYVFAISMEGVMLANLANRDLVGKDVTKMKDWNGTAYFLEMLNLAKEDGKGWAEYWRVRHGQENPTLTRAFVMRVPDEDLFLVATYYAQ